MTTPRYAMKQYFVCIFYSMADISKADHRRPIEAFSRLCERAGFDIPTEMIFSYGMIHEHRRFAQQRAGRLIAGH